MRMMITLVLWQISHILAQNFEKSVFDFCFFAVVMILAGMEDIRAYLK